MKTMQLLPLYTATIVVVGITRIVLLPSTDAYTILGRLSKSNTNHYHNVKTVIQENVATSTGRVFGITTNRNGPISTAVASSAAAGAILDAEIDKDSSSSSSSSSNDKNMIRRREIKDQILQLSQRTNRGFRANRNDRDLAKQLINEIAKLNPTLEPAKSYYTTTTTDGTNSPSIVDNNSPSIKGKWTLVYTDAPDITSLDQNPLAQLGRIGQECVPPYIKNVIEYTKPSWVQKLPFAGSTETTRIIQKVVVKGSATSTNPTKVQLQISGLQLESDDGTVQQQSEKNDINSSNNDDDISTRIAKVQDRIETYGLLPALIQVNPISIQGQFDAPFGQFEILYLDSEFRIIQTGQNYYAINVRQKVGSEWF